jgi:nucleoside-diphosphate-sugar epimerase
MAGNKTILLTGGNGFLGSNLLRRLLARGFHVLMTVRASSNLGRIEDLKDKVTLLPLEGTDLAGVFRTNKIDAVVHCATNYGRKVTSPLSILESNLMLPLRLLQLGAEHGVPCFVNTDTILDKRVSYYSLSKAQFREWLNLYSDRMACVNAALEHFYGPGDDDTKFTAWVTHSLINGVPKLDLTKGEQKRDFVYIDDAAEALMAVIEHIPPVGKGYFSYEVGSGKAVSIRELVTLIKRLSGNTATALNFGALPYRENEVMEYKVDLSSVAALGWAPKVALEEGLARTIELEKRRAG